MTTKEPRFFGLGPDSSDPVVSAYKKGVAERTAVRQQEKGAQIPDLVSADATFKPGRDNPMTIESIGAAQRAMESSAKGEEPRQPGLRPETVAGLEAMHKHAEAHYAERPSEPRPEPVQRSPASSEKEDLREKLENLDSLELQRMAQRINEDVINNVREREAVRKRLKPIDLDEGISTGVFKQIVPVVPGKLTVTYRSLVPYEERMIRALLFKMVSDDPRLEAMDGEVYGLMQVTASVMQINSTLFPEHLKGTAYKPEFDESIFLEKFTKFSMFPAQLISAIGAHAYWFDQRVRELFATENLKNI